MITIVIINIILTFNMSPIQYDDGGDADDEYDDDDDDDDDLTMSMMMMMSRMWMSIVTTIKFSISM